MHNFFFPKKIFSPQLYLENIPPLMVVDRRGSLVKGKTSSGSPHIVLLQLGGLFIPSRVVS